MQAQLRRARPADGGGLVARDVAINRLNREIFRLAIEAGDDVDIGEQTAFVVTGPFRAFADSSHVAAR